MKQLKGITIATLYAVVFSACSSSYMASQGEYDDMYYGSADRDREAFEDVRFNAYSNFREESDPLKIRDESDLPQDSYSAKTINPDYVEKYDTEIAESDGSEYGDGEYFSEEYDSEGNGSTIINNYYGYNPYRYNYAYYDPFWYDPFYPRFYFGSGWRVTLGYGYGYGYSRWNNWYLYDPYYGYSPSWIYSAYYCPTAGYYYGSYYGYGYSPYAYSNVIYYNNSYVNVSPDNINGRTRKIVRGARPSRNVVSNLTDNNSVRNSANSISNPSRSRTATVAESTPSQSSYYRRSRENTSVTRTEIDRSYSLRTPSSTQIRRASQSTRPSTNYVRPSTRRSSLYNTGNNQRSYGSYGIQNRTNSSRQRSSFEFRQLNPVQNRSSNLNRNYQINRSTPIRSNTPTRSSVAPSRSSSNRSSGTKSGSSSRPARKN